jgi:hypothetical protein
MKKTIIYRVLLTLGIVSLMVGCGTDNKKNAGSVPASQTGIAHSIACFENEQVKDIYVAHCYIHSVDGNSEPVIGLTFDMSLIVNVKEFHEGTGTIQTTNPITFSDDRIDFSTTDVVATDNLIILPTNKTLDVTYLGNWEIRSVSNILTLLESAFNLETTEELTYVVGNETVTRLGSRASAHIEYPEDKIVDNPDVDTVGGLFYFDIYYDPSLRGTTIFIGAHTTSNIRTGIGSGLILELEDAIVTP